MDNQDSTTQATKNQKERILDYKRTFSTEEGQRVLYDLMVFGNFLRPTLGHNNDVTEMAFNEGKRQMALRILTYCQLDMETINKFIEKRQGERNAKISNALKV